MRNEFSLHPPIPLHYVFFNGSYLLLKIYLHFAKDVFNKAKYDITIQTIGIPLCTFSTLWYSEIRHVFSIYSPLKHSIFMPHNIQILISHNFFNGYSYQKYVFWQLQAS